MKNPLTTPILKTSIGRAVVITTCVLAVIVITPFVSLFLQYNNPFVSNRAEEVAKPIEKSLIEAGAVKVCSRGATGYEATNRIPWYSATFKIDGTVEETQETVSTAAKDNGYILDAFTQENDYYSYAGASKTSEYSNLDNGDIGIAFNINLLTHYDVSASNGNCAQTNADGLEDGSTTFGLSVSLPERKK
ncbi:MAG: hypothetical protein PVI21_04775 [Candidatus Woesebacteria bacterium]|jgi:hypothetical protein